MQKIMFDDKFGLTQAVVNGTKTMTRRKEPSLSQLPEEIRDDEYIMQTIREDSILVERCYKGAKLGSWVVRPRFYLFETVAIAQNYESIANSHYCEEIGMMDSPTTFKKEFCGIGWRNKMFVKPEYMPHQIRITDYRVERLQQISDDDCLKEGIYVQKTLPKGYAYDATIDKNRKRWWFGTAKKAFEALINKISGKGTWNRNPWVLVYSFELIK